MKRGLGVIRSGQQFKSKHPNREILIREVGSISFSYASHACMYEMLIMIGPGVWTMHHAISKFAN